MRVWLSMELLVLVLGVVVSLFVIVVIVSSWRWVILCMLVCRSVSFVELCCMLCCAMEVFIVG